jgi:hypothetical protein
MDAHEQYLVVQGEQERAYGAPLNVSCTGNRSPDFAEQTPAGIS